MMLTCLPLQLACKVLQEKPYRANRHCDLLLDAAAAAVIKVSALFMPCLLTKMKSNSLSSPLPRTPGRQKLRQTKGKQNQGCTQPFSY